MKRKILTVILMLGVIVSGLSGCSSKGEESDSGEKKLVAGVIAGSGKLSYYDDKGELTGYEIELLKAIDKELDEYSIEFSVLEYKSLFVSLKSAKVDLVSANLRRNTEREEYLHTYRGYNSWVNKIVVKDDNTDIRSIEDLEGKKVGTGQGTLSAAYMENYIKSTGKNIELVYSTDMVADLAAGRVDCFIVADYLVDQYNEQYKQEGIQFKVVGGPIDTNEGVETDKNVYFFLSDGNEEARDAVSEAIYKLREDGTISKLMIKFFGVDYTDKIDVPEEEKQIEALEK